MSRGRNRRRAGVPARARPMRAVEALPAGSHLGDLSPEVTEIDVMFGWFGTDIRVNPTLSELDIIEFTARAMTIDEDSPEAIIAVKDSLRSYVHPDDFDTFWQAAVRHGVGLERLMLVIRTIVEQVSGHPTGRPSDSSAGPPKTVPNSKGDYSSRVIRRLDDSGRPDLSLAVVARSEAQAAG